MSSTPGLDRSVQLPDGRAVPVWDGGDPDGQPVMFHHGSPATRWQAALGAESAGHHGVRLLAFNRPGYGTSPDTPPSLASVGTDAVAIADALDIDRFAVMGVSGGGPFALATGLAGGARIRSVGVLGGVGPWRLIEPDDKEESERALLSLADAGDVPSALQGFKDQAAAELDRLVGLSGSPLVDAFFEGVPETEVSWLDAEGREIWAADLQEMLTNFDGYARDNVAWGGSWDIDPADLACPVWLWYGDRDQFVGLEHGRWYADRIPDAHLVVRPGDGHGPTCFAHWDETFATLLSQS